MRLLQQVSNQAVVYKLRSHGRLILTVTDRQELNDERFLPTKTMPYPSTEFTGACSEGSARGNPMAASSAKGKQPNEQARDHRNTDPSSCLVGNGHAWINHITITGSPSINDSVVNADAQAASGFGIA